MDITKAVNEANGDLVELYKALLKLTNGDMDKADKLIDDLILSEEAILKEGYSEIEEAKALATIAQNLPVTREHYAYLTSREFFRDAISRGVELTPAEEISKVKFYESRPLEASEDGIEL